METVSTARRVVRVLLVDDDPIVRRVMARLLAELFPVSVHEAADGLSALEILETSHVDVVLLDFSMPVMDGLEVLRAIRRSACASVPVVMLTSVAEVAVVRQLLRLGVSAYLLKPLSANELRDRLGPILADISQKERAAVSRTRLDLRKASQILLIDRDERVQQLWRAQLQGFLRFDAVAAPTVALRRFHSGAYDAVFVGDTEGMLDEHALVAKLRTLHGGRGPTILAIASAGGASQRPYEIYDGVVPKTTDATEWLRGLVPLLVRECLPTLVLALPEPYMAAMFASTADLLRDMLGQPVRTQQELPLVVREQPRWMSAQIDLECGNATWSLKLVCPYNAGLDATSTSRGVYEDLVSGREVEDTFGRLLKRIAEPLVNGLHDFNLECRLVDRMLQISSMGADATQPGRESARWFVADNLNFGALVYVKGPALKGNVGSSGLSREDISPVVSQKGYGSATRPIGR